MENSAKANAQKGNKNHYYLYLFLYFLFISFIFIFPFCITNSIDGDSQDVLFHLARLQNSYLNLKSGSLNILPQLSFNNTFGNIGYPVNMYYPLETMVPEAIIHYLTGNAVLSYYIFLFIIGIITAYIAYYVGIKLFKNRIVTIIFTTIYIFSQYRIIDFNSRCALGEGICFAFMPLVFYGAYQIATGNHKKWLSLPIGLSLIAYTHMLSLAMAIIFVGITLLMYFISRNEFKQRLWALIKSIAVTLLLSAYSIFPLLQQMQLVKPATFKIYLTRAATLFGNLVVDSLSNQVDAGNAGVNFGTHVNIGILGIVCIVFAVLAFKKLTKVDKFVFFEGLFFVFISTTLFPWQLFQKEADIIQFPWRFLEIASLLLALVGAKSFWIILKNSHITKDKIRNYTFLFLGLVCFLAFSTNYYILGESFDGLATQMGPFSVTQFLTSSNYNKGIEDYANSDYLPLDSTKQMVNLYSHAVQGVNTDKGSKKPKVYPTGKMRVSAKNQEVSYPIISAEKQIANLPNVLYIGMHAYVNGKEKPISSEKDGLASTPVPKGESTVTLKYIPTTIQNVSKWVSIISWLALIVGWAGYEINKLIKRRKLTK